MDVVEKILVSFLVLLGVFLIIILVSILVSDYQICQQYDNTDIPHIWGFWTGCRLQMPNGYWGNANDVTEYFYLQYEEVNQ